MSVPLLANVTAVVNVTSRTTTLTCALGKRFSTGYKTKEIGCISDGQWNEIETCQVTILIINILVFFGCLNNC